MNDGPRLFNRSAVKEHALKCSAERRAGKFTRVGEDFLTEFEADVEALIREIRIKCPVEPSDRVLLGETTFFVTGEFLNKLKVEMDDLFARMIQRKVQRQPSCGCTLGRTR